MLGSPPGPAAGRRWPVVGPDLDSPPSASGLCDDYEGRGLVGRPIFWRRDRRAAPRRSRRFLEDDSDYRAELGSRPVAAELAFGLPGAHLGAVAVACPTVGPSGSGARPTASTWPPTGLSR